MLSSQSWPLQAQSQLLTAAQPATTSAVGVQLSRSQEGLMQSTVPRMLTFSQQIRPQQQQQQVAMVTQKPLLSSVTRHSGQYAGLIFCNNNSNQHRASTSMYLLTFCIRFLLPKCHQWKPAVQTATIMLRTPPRRQSITGEPAMPTSHIRRAVLRTLPVTRQSAASARRSRPAGRSHYGVISWDGRKLVTRVPVMLP